MKNKMMLLALAAISAVMFVLPAVASAGSPVIDPGSGKFPLAFTSSGGHGELRATGEPAITCTSNTGSGKYTTSTTGEIGLTFHGCTTSFFGFPVACNSAGQPSGTIVTATSVFHTTYVTDAKTNPGVLVTPPSSGVFTTIICGGFANIEVKGNGIIGELTAPKCGVVSKTATLNFTAVGSSQTRTQVTGTGTVFSLNSVTEGGSTVTAAEVAEGTATYSPPGETATITCV
jgi:hypothetical protein